MAHNVGKTTLSCFSQGINPRKVALIDRHGVGESLLDIGCGNGLYPLKTSRQFARVLQIDIADRRCPEASHIPLRLMDASDVSVLTETYDTVICFDVIEHLDDDVEFVKKIRKQCTGSFIGSVPSDDDSQLRIVGLTHVHHVDKTHRREYSKTSLEELLKSAGFADVLIEPQWNEGLVAAPYALRTASIVSRICARLLIACNKLLCWLSVFRNKSVSDWFFIAR